MLMTCPNCSAEVEYIEGDSEICSECGRDLMPGNVQEEQSIPQSEPAVENSRSDFWEALKSSVFSSLSQPSEESSSLSERAEKMAENIEQMEFDRPVDNSQCPHLKVEYNRNVFFLGGSESVVKMKITPLDDQLQDMLVFVETERGGSSSRRQIPVRELLRKNCAFPLQFPFNPGDISGRMVLSFYIGCKVDGKFIYYQFSVDHKVYDSKQSGSALCSQININNIQDFSAGQASDINYRDSIGDALKMMTGKHLSVNEMIDRLNDMPPEYKVRKLLRTTWRPEDVLVKGNLYPTDKLTLDFNGKKIFLFNNVSVKLGRDSSEVDLVVRCGGGKIGPRDYPNSTVSRKHAEILYCEDSVKLFDYSSYGTYINGRKPDSSGIPLDSGATIEFGDIHWQMSIQKCHTRLPHNICQTCTANKVKSVTFKRTDDEPECYLLIWQCCELGRVIPELTDWTVFTRNNCFFIRTPAQDFFHLRPGQEVEYNGKFIKVEYFEQN